MATRAEQHLSQITRDAGVVIGGDNKWDITVTNPRAFTRIMQSGRLALGESFMDGDWDSDDLATCVSKLFTGGAVDKFASPSTVLLSLKSRLFNLQSRSRAFEVGREHYDYGNDMYEAMLGPSMVYTCADFSATDDLDTAQQNKLEMICRKLDLKPGMRLLDVGCGWGTLMKYAAEHYGVTCVGISVSQEQTAWARTSFGSLPCTIEIIDYRDFTDDQGFDRITSIEMIEAVGPKNFRTYFKKLHDLLRPEGRMLIQAIGDPSPVPHADPWIDKYIFPNGVLPSLSQIEQATRNLFHWDTLHDIGTSYDQTLMAWWHNLEAAFPDLQHKQKDKYNERFLRMFKYYLQICAALARTRNMYVWQIVFTKK